MDAICRAVITLTMEVAPSMAIYDGLSRSLAEGMIFSATGPEVYCGEVSNGADGGLHELRSNIDNTTRFVSAPPGTMMLVKQGEILEAAQPWARIFPDGFHYHRSDGGYVGLAARWAKLRNVFGGNSGLKRILKLWFEQQFIRLESQPSSVLIPASLVANVARQMRSRDVWWDTQPMLECYDWETQVAVLPPIPLRHVDGLRISLHGDVAVNASIVDTRWSRPWSDKPVRLGSIAFDGDSFQTCDAAVVRQQPHRSERELAIAG